MIAFNHKGSEEMAYNLWKFGLSALLPASLGLAMTAPALANDPVRIGVPTILSGAYAGVGNEALRAIEFAVQEANAQGGVDGRRIEISVLDTEGNPEVARRQAEKLALEGYNILIGVVASSEALAIAPMLERWDALYVSTITKTNKLTAEECGPRVFRVNHADNQDGAVIRPWLANQEQSKWAIIGADYAWGRDSGSTFSAAAQATNKEIVAEFYSPLGTNDYAPFIQQIKSSGADGLWVALAGRDAINFATQANEFGLLGDIFISGISFVTDGTVKVLGKTVEGVWDIINYSSTLDTPQNKAMVEAWRQHYNGDEPTNFEGETYLGVQIVLEAVKRAGSVEPIELARVMSGGTFDTIIGEVTIRSEDHQLVQPNYFGYIGEYEGKLRPIIVDAIPADEATPPPSPECKMPSF